MSKNTAKLRKVMSRDGDICGLHLGGCGRKIETRGEASLDHIISQSYIKSMDPERRTEFKGIWNAQPMCRECNRDKKGQVNGWPLFQCSCHYLQLIEDGNMYICELTEGEPQLKRHLFRTGTISDGHGVEFTANVGKWKDKNGVRWSGYADGSHPNFTEIGHGMACIPRFSLLLFNWLELVRVGRASDFLKFERSDGRFCIYQQRGQVILGGRGYEYVSRFDPARGYKNIYYDPFAPGKKVWMKVDKPSGIELIS